MAVSSINTECKRYGCIKNLLACYANCRYNSRCEELKVELADKTERATEDINTYLAERGRNPIAIQFMKRGLKFTDLKKAEPTSTRKKADNKSALISIEKPPPQTRAIRKAVAEEGAVKKPDIKPSALRRKRLKRKKASTTGTDRLASTQSSARGATYPEKNRASQSKQVTSKRRPTSKDNGVGSAVERASSEMAKKVPSRGKSVMRKKANHSQKSISSGQSGGASLTTHEAATETSLSPKISSARQKRRSAATGRAKSNGKLYIILDGKQASLVTERDLMSHLLNNPNSGARYFEAREVEARVQIVLKP